MKLVLTTMQQRSWDSNRSKRNSRFSLNTLFMRSAIKLLKSIVRPSNCTLNSKSNEREKRGGGEGVMM